MQRDSNQRLLRYSEIVADCRVAFTVLKILQHQWDASDEWLSMRLACGWTAPPICKGLATVLKVEEGALPTGSTGSGIE
jgi:hypothetical protein